jgi:hypothetical protein
VSNYQSNDASLLEQGYVVQNESKVAFNINDRTKNAQGARSLSHSTLSQEGMVNSNKNERHRMQKAYHSSINASKVSLGADA